MMLLYQFAAAAVFAVFAFYVFDIRNKPGMVPIVRPVFTRLMKLLSLGMLGTYAAVLATLSSLLPSDWAALGLEVLGAGLVASAKITLGRHHTWTGFHLEKTAIVRHGIYARLRHPLYTGVILFEIGGLAVVLPRTPPALVPLFLAVLIYLVTFNLLMARRESREMARKFGPEFARYQREVHAFLPWPRRPTATRGVA